jgi:hypothetical protein
MVMADATVGALRVTLGADTARFEDGLKRSESAMASFGKNIGTIAAGIGLERIIEKTMTFVVGTFTEGFERIDKVGKEAQKAGVGVEAFSGLQLSAELADVSMQTLTTSLGKLSKNMVDTASGTGEAKKTFDALGISVTNTDGTMKSADQVLIEIAGSFGGAADGASKTAAAIALLGRGGKELIPLLNEGAAGLEQMRATAESMGLIIDQNTSNAVQKFNDNLKILGKSGEGIANLVIAEIIPALLRLSELFVENARTGDFARTAAEAIIGEFKALAVAVNQAIVAVSLALQALTELKNILTSFPQIEQSAQAFNNFREIVTQWDAAMEAARGTALEWFTRTAVEGKKHTDNLSVSTSKLGDTLATLQLRTAVARGEFKQLATGMAEQAAQLGLTDKAAQGLSRTIEGLSPAQLKLNEAMLKYEGARMAQEALPPWEKYAEQLAKIDTLQKANAISAEEAGRLMVKAAENTGQSWDMVAEQSLAGWEKSLSAMAKQNKEFAIAAKGLAITMALINTYQGATKALAELPPPFSFIAAAGVIAFGLVQVAQIASQKFATGGSFRVGGGLTGMDSEMVAFRATPGEMVDVRRPGQAGAHDGVQTINLQLPRPADFFSVHVREMVTALNRAAPDGYVLKVQTA